MIMGVSHLARSPKQLGSVIQRARKLRKLSQAELGEKAGLWQETVSKIETGHSDAKLGTLLAVLAALDLELQVAPRSKGWPKLEELF